MPNFENHALHSGEGVPLFIAAGVLKQPAQLEQFMGVDPLLAPVLTLGGFTMTEWAGNAKSGQTDFIYYTDRQMAGNARGLPNPGKDGILALREPIRQLTDIGIKTIIQVTNLPHERPLDVIPDLVEIAATVNPTAVEVNLSCPNGKDPETGNLHPPLSSNPMASAEVMQESRRRVGQDVVLGAKDSPHVSSPQDTVDSMEVFDLAGGIAREIDFVVGINTIGGQAFPEIECAGGKGGMSGPVVETVAQEHLRIWRSLAPEVPYLSTGGVDGGNADTEIAARLHMGAMLVGGAQEFYRAASQRKLAEVWAISYLSGS